MGGPREQCFADDGTTKLYLGLQYIDATPRTIGRPTFRGSRPACCRDSGKAIERIAFKDCKTRDLERAIEGALAKPDAYDDAAMAHAKRGIDEDDLARVAKALLALARRRWPFSEMAKLAGVALGSFIRAADRAWRTVTSPWRE